MTDEKKGKGTGARYPLAIKLKAVKAYVLGAKKREVIDTIHCSRGVLDYWIRKYEEAVKHKLAEVEASDKEALDKELIEAEAAVQAAATNITTAIDNRPLAQQRRRPDGSLDLTEEERKLLILACCIEGRGVISLRTEINVSTLNRWRRYLLKYGATQKSLASSELPTIDTNRIYILRELLRKRQVQAYEIDREIDALKKAIDTLETSHVKANDTE